MLSLSGVSKSFDGRPALVDVTVTVPAGSRTALVGVNGSGKSTLLRLAGGLEIPDRGTVVRPDAVAYVPQDYALAADATVGDWLRDRAGVLAAERHLRDLEQRLSDDVGEALLAAFAEALESYQALGGYELEGRIDRAMAALDLPASLAGRTIGSLSGGQQVRVGLAGVLASRFALYLLDEPTNNLDLGALDLLEDFVATSDAAFLLVSHDRAFLDATATAVVELDEHAHTAETYGVSFAEYRALRERVLAARSARYRAYVDEVDRLRSGVRAQRQASVPSTRRPRRDNDKFAPHFFAQRQGKQAGRTMRALEQRLARLETVEEPRTGWELRLALDAGGRSGDLVAEADGAVRRLGSFTLGPVSLALGRGDRVALQGHNGAGKSQLLEVLTGAVPPDQGTIRVGPRSGSAVCARAPRT